MDNKKVIEAYRTIKEFCGEHRTCPSCALYGICDAPAQDMDIEEIKERLSKESEVKQWIKDHCGAGYMIMAGMVYQKKHGMRY
jgi:hypothetical protein